MSVKLSPIGNDAPFVDASGDPLSGGLLYAYAAGSSAPQDTYTTSAGSVANANPVVLDSNGYPSSGGNVVEIWLTSGISYKFVLKTSASVTVWTRDNIDGINDTSVSLDQWISSGLTPTYVSSTSFTVAGDQTTALQVGRRVKSTNSGGTVYSVIVTSVFGALTTVTLANDSGSIDSGISSFSLGLLTPTNPSAPIALDTYPIVSGSSDRTKKARFEVDGLTTATTRTYTLQDSSDTLVGRATTDTLSNKTLASGTVGTTQAAADNSTKLATTAYVDRAAGGTLVTNSLSGDVALNNTSNYFDGPSVAQGTSGTWWASGTVTVYSGGIADVVNVKLWDGTTVIASAAGNVPSGAGQYMSFSLSGYLATPAGNIRISVRDLSSTSGALLYNQSGNSKDCTISVIRVA